MRIHELALDKLDDATPAEIRSALPNTETLEQIARTFHALADPTRSKIVLALIRQELSVGDLAVAIGASQSNVSHHLRGLRDIRLVKVRRDGNAMFYSIDDSHVGNLFREAAAHLDHVYANLPDSQSEQLTPLQNG